jgi:hypothetical protein
MEADRMARARLLGLRHRPSRPYAEGRKPLSVIAEASLRTPVPDYLRLAEKVGQSIHDPMWAWLKTAIEAPIEAC